MTARIEKGASFTMTAVPWATKAPISLGPKDAEDLRYLWGEDESAAGIRAINYGNMGDARGSGGTFDPFCNLDPWSGHRREQVRKSARARATLAKLTPLHACILFKFYGPFRPVPALGTFADLAPILGYVPSVERLAATRGTTVTEAVSKRLLETGALDFVRSTKAAAERLLSQACEAYIAAKGDGR